ncbi:MAG TPA: SRPBCC domain-containing protein, partial [Flavitalea sp.]|nr:SRPBCC domain-containing protein [Flavitalea sp.]
MTNTGNTKDRELFLSRTLNAPVALVWEIWTKPEHIGSWWGPKEFTCTIHTMDLRPGGHWDRTLHGPDGTDYINKSIFKEVIPFRKIVYEHISDPWILATIQFEDQGEKTLLTWHMLFESKEKFIEVVKAHKADVGLRQNADKIEVYLEEMKKKSGI